MTRIVCVVGPTASGKTTLALELGERLGAEVVSADSRQVYRRLDVGTAKPSAAERARVAHHCLDLVDPEETFDAAQFRDAAQAAIADVGRRGRPVLVVGGTGLYVRALVRGLCAAPRGDDALRAALAAVSPDERRRRLVAVDPAAAARIHPNDTVRTIRALEVAEVSGRPLSAWQAAHAFAGGAFDPLLIGLACPPDVLDARIAARARDMLARGFLDEVHALSATVPVDAPAWRTVGYREMRACAEGRTDVDAALAATVLATRQFAKRQRTWFRREPGLVWRDPVADRGRLVDEVLGFLDGAPAAVVPGS